MARADKRREKREGLTIKVGVSERLQLLQMTAPMTGDILSLRSMRQFREELSFGDAEIQTLQLRNEPIVGPDGRPSTVARWDGEGAPVKGVWVPQRAKQMIDERFAQMEAKKQMTLALLPVYDLFHPSDSKNGAAEIEDEGETDPPAAEEEGS